METRIDKELAYEFLNLLDSKSQKFTFQTFFDGQQPKKESFIDDKHFAREIAKYYNHRKKTTKVLNGSLEEHLDELNFIQKMGGGVFVAINETDLAGRKIQNVKAVRAFFIDNDDNRKINFDFQPSLKISSKRGGHAYFLLRDHEPLEIFSTVQYSLAKHFGTDPNIKDLSRVMRLPGSFHLKDFKDPFKITIDEISPVKYSSWEIISKIELNYGASK